VIGAFWSTTNAIDYNVTPIE